MTYKTERIYILVKTYPTISKEYAELVCTAGILETGEWIRLYPIPFRKLDVEQHYPKYSWMTVDVERNKRDFRPETFRPDISTIKVEPKPKKTDWTLRRKIILGNTGVFTSLEKLTDRSQREYRSLAIFKPSKILDFKCEKVEREWPKDTLTILKGLSQQQNFFQTPEEIAKEFKVVKKVPYRFSYKFEDDVGLPATLMIEDWEIGMLYFNCLKKADNCEEIALGKVREKYFDAFTKADLYFFLGTTKQFHYVASNPYIIVGVFYPPHLPNEQQMSFFDI